MARAMLLNKIKEQVSTYGDFSSDSLPPVPGKTDFMKPVFFLFLCICSLLPAARTNAAGNQVVLTPAEKAFIAAHPLITLGTEKSWAPYVILQKNGTITGYDAEILSKINKLTGSNFQLKVGSWLDMQQQAKERKIDGLSTGGIHEERKKYLNFSNIYISLQKLLIVAKGNPSDIRTLDDLKGKRIALHRGNLVDEKLAKKIPNSEIIPMDTVEEVIKAVINGQVDATFGNGVTLYLAQKLGIPFLEMSIDLQAPLNLAFGVRNDWPEAVIILNKGLAAIPEYERLLIQRKWFSGGTEVLAGSEQPSQLLPKEKEWLRNHPVIRVHAANAPPYYFQDNGQKGILVELLDLVAVRLGIRMEYITGISSTEALNSIKERSQVDLLLTFLHTTNTEDFLVFSRESLRMPWVIFTREDERGVFGMKDLAGKTIAIEKNRPLQQRLILESPEIRQHLTDSTVQALQVLSDNRADAYIGNLTVAQYYIVQEGLNNLKVAAPTEYVNDIHLFAVRSDWPILAEILDKELAAITPEERSTINRKYFAINVEQGVNLLQMLWIFTGLLLVLLLILFWNYRLQREIKTRRKAEQALSKSEEMFRTIFENVPALINAFAENGKCTLWNNACEKTFGWTIDEINAAEDPLSLFYPDPEIRKQIVLNGTAGRNSIFSKWHPQTKDGKTLTTRRIDFTISDGTVIHLGIDETLLESHTTELRKLSRAVEQSHSTIVITDLNGTIEFVNPAFSKSTGYSRTEALGQNPRILKSGLQGKSIYQDLWDTLTKGEVWQGELHNKRKDGSCYWEFASISPVKDETGITTHYVAVKEDISDRKRTEQQLIEAQQRAEAASQAKSDFLANMSHEVRTPLNAIIGMNHLARQTSLTEKQLDYLNKVDSAANDLRRIIDDILDFSKIEAGKLDIEKIPFYLGDVLENLKNLTEITAAEKNLLLTISPDTDVPDRLVGDPLRLGQILLNLVNNALKFTSRGEIAIRVNWLDNEEDREADKSITLQFSVSDTGIGMTGSQLNSLFQSFTQADTSTTRKFGGTGLGLTICKQLVTLMGGEIKGSSQPEKGSTFTFTIRFGTTDIVCASRSSEETDRIAVAAIGGSRILVVDDNLLNQQVVQELLTMNQFIVTTVVNGQEAVEAVQNYSFDAVLMDIHMPVLDGLAATQVIRNDPHFNGLPIIAMTASAMAEDRRMGFSAGMNDYISKPIDPDSLLQVLTRWIPAKQQPVSSLPMYPADGDDRQLPASLPGINIQTGLRWTSGKQSLLRKLMEQFYSKHNRDVQLIRQALEDDEQDKARRIAHTAKGVAGTIGAIRLQRAATAVDAAFKTNNLDALPPLLERMEKALLEVLSGLQLICVPANGKNKTERTTQLDMENLESMLNQARVLVHELDPEAEEVASNLLQALDGSPFHETARCLLHQVEETEFDAAGITLTQLQSALQASETEENTHS